MNILISNDDGIKAEGIIKLAEALCGLGDVYVFAPSSQRSASSHALSISSQMEVKRADFPVAGIKEAWSVDGTPADCVKLGMYILGRRGIKVDVVYSGINHGANLGTDTMYSGTVAAAAEGAFEGIPAVAASVDSHNPQYFEGCAALAAKVLPHALKTAGRGLVININTPDLPAEQIKGVKPARTGQVKYDAWFEQVRTDGESGEGVYCYSGEPVDVESWTGDTDARLVRSGWAAIAMIEFDPDYKAGFEEIKKWEIEI